VPDTTGGLRGYKGSMYEGGLRVPCVIEWPAGIRKARITKYPAGAVDIFPTLAEVCGLPKSSMLQPQDGLSLKPLFARDIARRSKPLPFQSRDRLGVIANEYKLLSSPGRNGPRLELYHLEKDPAETTNLIKTEPAVTAALSRDLEATRRSIAASVAGKDYPEGKVGPQPPRIFWNTVEAYKPYFPEWSKRPEYSGWLKRKLK